jgi:Tol biopolymer transport system component
MEVGMKRIIKLIYIVLIATLLASCETASPVPSNLETVVPASTATQVAPTSYPSPTSKSSPTPLPTLVFSKIPTANNSQTKLSNQCLTETYSPPTSNSIIVVRSLKHVVDYQSPDIILIDMSKAQPDETILKTHITPNFAVSGDGKLIAYEASIIKDEKVTQVDLLIANGNFQTQHTIPWDDRWYSILGWTTDQKIIISSPKLKTTSKPPYSYILVDPFNGRQQAIHLKISDFLDESLYDLPYWGGWYGLSIDPTLKLAVYPRQNNISKDMYTYALWDISSNKALFSLEKVFSAFSSSTNSFSIPRWSIDGTQFAFVGVNQSVLPITFELFLVNRKGDVKSTNISDIAYLWDSSLSWSPDNSHIVSLLTPPQEGAFENANIALVNTNTLEVTDLCLSVGVKESAPIWSPNGAQFLIVDYDEKDRQRVLLVDIEKNIVYPIAKDAEPIGWMVAP